MHYIFDLDHTVIDSSHRQVTLADGSLDLAHWIENSTREKIMGDSLLPLADMMRDLIARKKDVIICTARVMGDSDYDFLRTHGLWVPDILSRPEGLKISDQYLKSNLLAAFAVTRRESFARFCSRSIMFDDNQNVQKHLQSLGIRVYNAISINERLAA